jgi:hypothetical protein
MNGTVRQRTALQNVKTLKLLIHRRGDEGLVVEQVMGQISQNFVRSDPHSGISDPFQSKLLLPKSVPVLRFWTDPRFPDHTILRVRFNFYLHICADLTHTPLSLLLSPTLPF